MRVLVAFDKFKDSLSASEACELAASAIREGHPDWQLDLCPLADGGEGFADILTRSAGGRTHITQVAGPRGGLVKAAIGLVSANRVPAAARVRLQLDGGPADARPIAIVEMASASGLALLAPDLRDPWQTTSLGTGQLICAAAESGAGLVILGVGGSATHDLGLGALNALGLDFFAADGRRLQPPVPALWPDLVRIAGRVTPSIPPIRIACDVDNPLLGARGAAAVFGPQKGLADADYDRLEGESSRIARLLCEHCGRDGDLASTAGAGAAGGTSFGLMAAAGARLLPGSALVADWLDLEARLAAADIVLTGEGSFDESSRGGKGPGALVERARVLGKPAHVFAGRIAAPDTGPAVTLHAITAAGVPLPKALRQAGTNLSASVRAAFAG